MLEPLSEAETRELVASLAADDAPRLAGRIWEAAEGNPLFAEEMLRMLTDENGDGEARIPPTINALLAARLDRLEADERAVAQSAAVIGRQFGWLGVTELVPPELRSRVAPCLQALVRRQVVLPDEPTAFDEDGFRFAHILMRDAASLSLGKARRSPCSTPRPSSSDSGQARFSPQPAGERSTAATCAPRRPSSDELHRWVPRIIQSRSHSPTITPLH